MNIPEQLVQRIALLQSPAIIAISGFGGAGKSSVASTLGSKIGAPIVCTDSFISDRTLSNYDYWGNKDFQRLEREVLSPFMEGKSVRYGHLDWGKNVIGETRDLPLTERMIVEGVGLFRPTLRHYLSFMIWVDCPMPEAIRRGKKRDREEYNHQPDEAWDGIWKRNDEEYFNQFKPKEAAHFIIDNFAATTAEPNGAPNAL
jgi:uridine kinase